MEIDFLMKLAKAYNRCDCFTEFNNRQRLAFGSAPAVAHARQLKGLGF
jgi:hypothetical protein